jgi:hypothetical protein
MNNETLYKSVPKAFGINCANEVDKRNSAGVKKNKNCQPEPVEGGLLMKSLRLRQAQPDTLNFITLRLCVKKLLHPEIKRNRYNGFVIVFIEFNIG